MSLGKEFCVGVQAEHERRAVLAAHAKAAEVASLLAFLSAAQKNHDDMWAMQGTFPLTEY